MQKKSIQVTFEKKEQDYSCSFFLLARLAEVVDRLPQNYCFIISLEQKPMIFCHPPNVRLKVAQLAPLCVATCFYSQGAVLLLKAEFAQHRFFSNSTVIRMFFHFTGLCN